MPRTGMPPAEVRAKAIDHALVRIRQQGFDRVRLSDVAKDLGVSHAALYAHFADKEALLGAVTERWLDATVARLEDVCSGQEEPILKIRHWFLTLYRIKRERAHADPELYRSFNVAAARARPFVIAHFVTINQQLAGLVAEAAATLDGDTAQRQAEILYEAMSAFHHPKLVVESAHEDREQLLLRVLDAVLTGLAAGPNHDAAMTHREGTTR